MSNWIGEYHFNQDKLDNLIYFAPNTLNIYIIEDENTDESALVYSNKSSENMWNVILRELRQEWNIDVINGTLSVDEDVAAQYDRLIGVRDRLNFSSLKQIIPELKHIDVYSLEYYAKEYVNQYLSSNLDKASLLNYLFSEMNNNVFKNMITQYTIKALGHEEMVKKARAYLSASVPFYIGILKTLLYYGTDKILLKSRDFKKINMIKLIKQVKMLPENPLPENVSCLLGISKATFSTGVVEAFGDYIE